LDGKLNIVASTSIKVTGPSLMVAYNNGDGKRTTGRREANMKSLLKQ
jgi:hypothetical protein